MHDSAHQHSGQYFRIDIGKSKTPAIYDQMIHGSLFQLLDWADRMQFNSQFSEKEKTAAVSHYLGRCLPEPIEATERDFPADLVCGSIRRRSGYSALGVEDGEFLVLVHEQDLTDIHARLHPSMAWSEVRGRGNPRDYKAGMKVVCCIVEPFDRGYIVVTKKGDRAVISTNKILNEGQEILAQFICWSSAIGYMLFMPIFSKD